MLERQDIFTSNENVRGHYELEKTPTPLPRARHTPSPGNVPLEVRSHVRIAHVRLVYA
jgi:hypothetical protein